MARMAIREILEAPDARLKVVSEPVTQFDDELKTLVEDMFETMYDAPGIGLAAIQVGVPKRVLVIDLQPEDPDAEPVECAHDGHSHTHPATKNDPRVFINPVIVDPAKELFAPAIAITALDLLFKVGNNAWRAVADLSMYALIVFALYLLFVAVRWPVGRWWQARKGPAPIADPEPTHREMMSRDEQDFGDTRYDARGDRRLRVEPRL